MVYEVRVNGIAVGYFASQQEAVACVRLVLQEQVDCEPEILDSETGRAVAPGSSRRWREHLANEVGY